MQIFGPDSNYQAKQIRKYSPYISKGFTVTFKNGVQSACYSAPNFKPLAWSEKFNGKVE